MGRSLFTEGIGPPWRHLETEGRPAAETVPPAGGSGRCQQAHSQGDTFQRNKCVREASPETQNREDVDMYLSIYLHLYTLYINTLYIYYIDIH